MKKKYIISVGVLGLAAYISTLIKNRKKQPTMSVMTSSAPNVQVVEQEPVVLEINDSNYQNYFDDSQRAYPKLMIPAGVDVIHISTTNKLRFCLIVPQDEMDSDITNGKRITLMGNYSVYPSSSGYGINSYYYTYETVNYEEAQRSNAFEDFIFWSGTWYSRFYV